MDNSPICQISFLEKMGLIIRQNSGFNQGLQKTDVIGPLKQPRMFMGF